MLFDMLGLSGMHMAYRTLTQPIPLPFKQRSSDMCSGFIRPSGGSPLMLLGILSVGAAYLDIVRQTPGEVSGISGAPEGYGRASRMHGSYGAYGSFLCNVCFPC